MYRHEVIQIRTTSSVAKFKENIAITDEGRINRNKATSNGSITQMNGFESTANAALAVIRTGAKCERDFANNERVLSHKRMRNECNYKLQLQSCVCTHVYVVGGIHLHVNLYSYILRIWDGTMATLMLEKSI